MKILHGAKMALALQGNDMDNLMKFAIGCGAAYVFRWMIPFLIVGLLALKVIEFIKGRAI